MISFLLRNAKEKKVHPFHRVIRNEKNLEGEFHPESIYSNKVKAILGLRAKHKEEITKNSRVYARTIKKMYNGRIFWNMIKKESGRR